ncbi:MAG TPA: plastocyanin/azurin family copper-binding protein [Chloroflexota bacterium]|nr:plastocyanin/azurin family copper-binding protein [Chloroflexota bacterium]
MIGLLSSVATVALAGALALQSLVGIPRASAQQAPPAGPASAPPAQQPPPTGSPVITVDAGAFDPSTQAEVLEFLPRTVRVPVGGAIHWRVNGFHNVAFPSGAQPPELIVPVPGTQDVQVNPLVAFPVQPAPTYDGTTYFNSGLPQPNQQDFEWTLTFSKPGAYAYLCSVHPNMQAFVVVEPAGTAVPTQDEVTVQGQREAQQYFADAQTAVQRQQAAVPAAATGGTWTVSMDAPDSPHYALQRFFPQTLTIQAGDTVRWVNPSVAEPHTVTFRAGAPRESEFTPIPQPNGPPMIMGNPRVLAPVVPPSPYDGQSYANSGFLGEGFPFGRDFSLTFSQPGTYQYVCVLHEDLGMSGFVVVTPRG